MWKFIIAAAAAFMLWKMFMGDSKRRKEEAKQERETLIAKGEMVKDPACGAYVSPEDSVQASIDGQTRHFCSYECRDAYIRQLRSGSNDNKG
ncbi:transcriptional regulator [Fundidesulfovibrio soli]|uniref:transcriptional regulator n=1 Tax=Fundidesulfovibrio soli TaxID=2922716 RepID=UPI001FAE9281|nr:transcriptional regulator [Fundidesulfovibrio soli]